MLEDFLIMNDKDYKEYLDRQKDEILKYKWIKNEKISKEIDSNDIAMEWILKYSSHFRNVWHCENQCDCLDKDSCPIKRGLEEKKPKDAESIFLADKQYRESCENLKKIKEQFKKGNK
jgi:hypothetical protein